MLTRKILWAMIIVFAILLAVYFYISLNQVPKTTVTCGDGNCAKSESCDSCPEDCACKNGAYCSDGKCVVVECGDGECGLGENSENCCLDCGCIESDATCDTVTQKCGYPETPISDEAVEEAINEYYSERNLTISKIEITGSSIREGVRIKSAFVYIEGETYERFVDVDEHGEVVSELFRW